MTPETKKLPAFVGVIEAAGRLGVHPNTLRAALLRNEIPHLRLGRALRIATTVLEKIEASGSLPSTLTEDKE